MQRTDHSIEQKLRAKVFMLQTNVESLKKQLSKVTAERDELKKNDKSVMCGKWLSCTERGIFGRKWLVCSNCESMNGTMIRFNFCPNCGARMRGTDKNG